MKRLILLVSLVLFSFFSLIDNHKEQPYLANTENALSLSCPDYLSIEPNINGTSQINKQNTGVKNISDDWYSQAINKIRQEEYNITYSGESRAFQSPNRVNNILFTYYSNGFTAKTLQTKIPLSDMNDKNLREEDKKYKYTKDWSIELRIKNSELGINNYELTSAGNKASIENGLIRIEYANSNEGMRQNFIIKERPLHELSIQIKTSTKLKMSVNKSSVSFCSKDGAVQMQYSSLKVWDATGRELAAYFEKQSSDIFAMKVNDQDALYPVTIDPLSNTPDWIKGGFDYGDDFGYSVADAGDLNRDGYSDVIIGSPNYWLNLPGAGRVSVFYGSASGLSTNAGWTFEGIKEYAKLGFSVSGAGDVNGDNYPDIIIGAPYSSFMRGKIYLFYGSASGFQDTSVWTYESDQPSAKVGYSVSKAGDINNDGFDDVIVGSPGYPNNFYMAQGRVFIFKGSSIGLSSEPDVSFKNMLDGFTGMGNNVSYGGDINNDGYSDVLFGEPYWPPPSSMSSASTLESQGRIMIAFGSSSGIQSTSAIQGEQSHSLFGYSVSSAGDVDNDGYSDIVIGSPNYHPDCVSTGKSYVYKGSASGISSSPLWTKDCYNSVPQTAGFGSSVSSTDINNDGYSDIIIGAHYTDWDITIDTTKYSAYVYYGSASGPAANCGWYYEIPDIYNTYITVSGLNDVNGDGFGEVILGTKRFNVFPTSNALVFYGGSTISVSTPDWTVNGENESNWFGRCVSTAGDVNNDGYDDVLISDPSINKVYCYYGSISGPSITADWTAIGEGSFGYAVSTAGDVNNDGFDDIIISSPNINEGGLYGKVFLYLGSASGLPASPSWSCGALGPGGSFGFCLSNAGDVNGDGYSDIVLGTNDNQIYNSHNVGAYVFCGSINGITGNVPSWTASTPLSVTQPGFGVSVSNAGDVNGDNFDDVIVGVSAYDDETYGKALVYFGSSNRGMFESENWSKEVTAAHTFFGQSVSDAGDVNQDGFDDILISDKYAAEVQGEVYLFNGSAAGPSNSYSWHTTGYWSSMLGSSITAAGDYNGDGFPDVVVGELHGFNPGIHLFFGSANGLSVTEDVPFYPGTFSLSGPADYNGDGFDDILGGFWYYNDRAGIFYGRANILNVYPKSAIILISENYCVNAVMTSQTGKAMAGKNISFIIKGANRDSASLITNSNGIAQFCYAGPNHGIDTIICRSGKSMDTSIVVRDFPTPVELASFTSSVSGRDVILSWTTASEINNSGFEVEKSNVKSQMSNEWRKVGFVQGIGNSEAVNNYEFTEKGLNTGKYNYRLKQIDFNGNFKYYELSEEVNIGIPNKYDLSQNYPNPFNPVTTINYDLPKDGIVTIKLYDILGREMKILVNEMKTAGYYKIQFSAGNLSSGVYFYRMTAGDYVAVKKFVVLK